VVPNKILQRTFHIAHADSIGTGFTLDADGRQYLATAKHVVEGLEPNTAIGVLRNGEWQDTLIGAVWHSPTGADLALISLKHQLSPSHLISHVGAENQFYLSQQIYFLGFPYGMHMEAGQINDGFPVPFVKTGIVANFSMVSGGSQIIYCDGHNNPGFSGGPIVTVSAKNEVNVVAVVSAYRYNEDPILLNGEETGLTYRANTGLVIGYGARELFLQAHASRDGAIIE
jgi:S1-C subfamily serine protease